MIHLEDCRDTLKRNLEYHYILCSPPDYDEVGLDPKKDSYSIFLQTWIPLLQPKNNFISICMTDRKSDGIIYSKHIDVIQTMKENNWHLKTHKLWIKSTGINMFRLNYMHLMTFKRDKSKANLTRDFKPDVFVMDKSYRYNGYGYGMPLDICSLLINEHTNENEIVYDPFMGSGTTAIASILNKRKYLGSEIKEEYYNLCQQRITEMN